MTERPTPVQLPGFEVKFDGKKTKLQMPKRGEIQPVAQRVRETGIRPLWLPKDVDVSIEPVNTRVKDD